MNYEQFKNEIIAILTTRCPDKKIETFTVDKNNGISLDGMTIIREHEQMSPTTYFNEYYKLYEKGESIEKLADDIIHVYDTFRYKKPMELEEYFDYSKMENRIMLKLISKKKNEKLLAEIPYIPFLDMAVVFYCMVEHKTLGTATILIYNKHLESWNKKSTDLFDAGWKNTHEKLSFRFGSIETIIAELEEGTWDDPEDVKFTRKEPQGMYVLTNDLRMFGATAILYPRLLKNLGETLGEDFYVLPSSIHEVILVKASMIKNIDSLKEMVEGINLAHVEPEEILSDQVYYYDRAEEQLRIARAIQESE